MRVRLSEIDLDCLYKVARGMTYGQIAMAEGLAVQSIKNRMARCVQKFGALSMPHLIATLIASDVLRLHDLYQELDVEILPYRRDGKRENGYDIRSVMVGYGS